MLNVVITSGLIILGVRLLIAQLYYSDLGFNVVKTDENFRYALSLSPFSEKSIIKEGYTYEYNDKQITTMKELEQLYIERGASEMYVRVATKKSVTSEDITDGRKIQMQMFIHSIKLWFYAKLLQISIFLLILK